MKLFVIGNINSGKTTLCKQILAQFPEYKYLAIDEFRIRFGDYTYEGELRSRNAFIEEVLRTEDAIVEFAGGGPIGTALKEHLAPNSIIVIHVDAPLEVCLERLPLKDFSHIPYPKFDESIQTTIKRIDFEINQGLYPHMWEGCAFQIFQVKRQEDVNLIPLHHFHALFSLTKQIRTHISDPKLYAFGSLGRRQLTPLSDIDLFLLTPLEAKEIFGILGSLYLPHEISLMKNQVSLRLGKLLIEIDVIHDIQESSKFYYMSLIKEASKTVLIGDNNFGKDLQKMLEGYTYSLDDELDYIRQRLIYFVLSLPILIERGDDYKYYFHNNIIIHELIRYRAISSGHPEFNYLPKKAKSLLNEEEWNVMLYDFKKEKEEHSRQVKQLIDNELN